MINRFFIINRQKVIENIDIIDEHISLKDFRRLHLLRHLPCVFKNQNVNGKNMDNVSEDYFLSIYGSSKAILKLGDRVVEDVTVGQWFKHAMFNQGWYLKDFHLNIERPDVKVYNCPEYFQDDWLNAYFKRDVRPVNDDDDDFQFLYWGKADTSSTGVHEDVLCSNTWSFNFLGNKVWKIFKNWKSSDGPFIEFVQKPGDVVFIPGGWYHSVDNVSDCSDSRTTHGSSSTISVNHNWFNASSIDLVWDYLSREELSNVINSLDGYDLNVNDKFEYSDLVFKILKANCSLGIFEFLELIVYGFEQLLLVERDPNWTRFSFQQVVLILTDFLDRFVENPVEIVCTDTVAINRCKLFMEKYKDHFT